MKIRDAATKDKEKSLNICKSLPEWFTKEAIKNIKTDLKLNNSIVAVEKDEVIGFVCYSSHEGMLKLLWMAVKRENRGNGIGRNILKHLEKTAKKNGLRSIEVKTLTDKDKYEPYTSTRNFYKKNGYKKIGYEKSRVKGWDDQIILEKIIK